MKTEQNESVYNLYKLLSELGIMIFFSDVHEFASGVKGFIKTREQQVHSTDSLSRGDCYSFFYIPW